MTKSLARMVTTDGRTDTRSGPLDGASGNRLSPNTCDHWSTSTRSASTRTAKPDSGKVGSWPIARMPRVGTHFLTAGSSRRSKAIRIDSPKRAVISSPVGPAANGLISRTSGNATSADLANGAGKTLPKPTRSDLTRSRVLAPWMLSWASYRELPERRRKSSLSANWRRPAALTAPTARTSIGGFAATVRVCVSASSAIGPPRNRALRSRSAKPRSEKSS